MKIFIKYKNKQKLIETYDYQSIASIINKYLENNDNNDIDINNYFIDYNGAYLNCNFSLEKYNIQSNSVLTLNDKNRGGNSFFSFAAKHPATVALCFLIALLPVIILPMGYVPSVATLILLQFISPRVTIELIRKLLPVILIVSSIVPLFGDTLPTVSK